MITIWVFWIYFIDVNYIIMHYVAFKSSRRRFLQMFRLLVCNKYILTNHRLYFLLTAYILSSHKITDNSEIALFISIKIHIYNSIQGYYNIDLLVCRCFFHFCTGLQKQLSVLQWSDFFNNFFLVKVLQKFHITRRSIGNWKHNRCASSLLLKFDCQYCSNFRNL